MFGWALSIALAKPAPYVRGFSEERAAQWDDFSVFVGYGDEPRRIQIFERESLFVRCRIPSEGWRRLDLTIEDAMDLDFTCVRRLRGMEFTYMSPEELVVKETLRWPHVQVWLRDRQNTKLDS